MNMLTPGNGKLGDGIYVWSLPAVDTCPGASPACLKHCYARRGRVRLQRRRYLANLEASQGNGFVALMVREIHRRFVGCVRIHVSGDFYSAAYVKAWTEIVRACPHVRFYAYTRSWRVAVMRRALEGLAKCRNMRLWYSCDRDTGTPEHIPARVRLAYMQLADGEMPGKSGLVFRIHPLRKRVAKRVGLSLVCPSENGVTDTTCQKCRVCIN